MVASKVVVPNPKGIHLKPAGFLCNVALEYQSHITISVNNKSVNAKSVLGVLSACIKYGNEIEVVCDGPDEQIALDTIVTNIKQGLGDDLEV